MSCSIQHIFVIPLENEPIMVIVAIYGLCNSEQFLFSSYFCVFFTKLVLILNLQQ